MSTIPEISKERVVELLARVRPLVETLEGKREIEPVCPWTKSFIWSPKPVGEVVDGLELLGKHYTYHAWGHYSLFKPGLAEVMACLDGVPELEQATHFWLDSATAQEPGQPLLHCPDKNNINGYHRALVSLYRRV